MRFLLVLCSYNFSPIHLLAETPRVSGSIQEVPRVTNRVPKGTVLVPQLLCGTAGEVSSDVIQKYLERLEHG